MALSIPAGCGWLIACTWLLVLGLSIPGALSSSIESCPGYKASNVQKTSGKLTADLTFAGDECNVYGSDIKDLRLLVEYQSSRLSPNFK